MKNKAAFMTSLKQMEIREVGMPKVGTKDVLVKLEYVGICGSDVHYYEHGRIGDFVVEGDFMLGHECAGTVVEVGSEVTHLKRGDRVALEPGVTCGKCEYCKTGRYNLCPDVQFLATPPYQGCYENYIAHPADMAFKLPESISTKEGALIEPLAVGLEAAKTSGVTLGSRVTILGAGCIGLTTLLACKAYGATDITVVDVLPLRLEKAMELGATRVINGAEKNTVGEYASITEGEGADIVIETAGAVVTTQQSVELVKRGGTIVLVGMAPVDSYEFNFAKLMSKVAEIKTIFRYKNLYPVAIQAVGEGRIDISKIVTHEFDFKDIAHAFDVAMNNKSEMVKGIIKIGELNKR